MIKWFILKETINGPQTTNVKIDQHLESMKSKDLLNNMNYDNLANEKSCLWSTKGRISCNELTLGE